MVAIVTMVTAPVVVAPTLASTATPALGIGADTNLEIEVARHIAEHVAPDIIKEIEVVAPAIITAPTIAMVVIPGHVDRDRARREQDQNCREHCLNSFHSSDLD
jgi:hypothetical protein